MFSQSCFCPEIVLLDAVFIHLLQSFSQIMPEFNELLAVVLDFHCTEQSLGRRANPPILTLSRDLPSPKTQGMSAELPPCSRLSSTTVYRLTLQRSKSTTPEVRRVRDGVSHAGPQTSCSLLRATLATWQLRPGLSVTVLG